MTKYNFAFKMIAAIATLLATAVLSGASWAEDIPGESRTFPEPRRVIDREEQAPSIGIHTGVSGTEGSYDNSQDWGIVAAFQPFIPFSAGLELSGYTSNAAGGRPGLTRTELLGKATYNFGGLIPVIRYSYVGAGLGPVWDNQANTSHISLGLAPLLGFDIPVGMSEESRTHFTLGAAGSYLFVNNGMPDTLAVNGTAKYWF